MATVRPFSLMAATAASDRQCVLASDQLLFALGQLFTEVDERVEQAVEDDQQAERAQQSVVCPPAVRRDVRPSHADVVGQPTGDIDVDQHQRGLQHLERSASDTNHVRWLATY